MERCSSSKLVKKLFAKTTTKIYKLNALKKKLIYFSVSRYFIGNIHLCTTCMQPLKIHMHHNTQVNVRDSLWDSVL